MREELRNYYRMLRITFGIYCFLFSAVAIGVIPAQRGVSDTWALDAGLAVFSILFAFVLMIKQVTPRWLIKPRTTPAGVVAISMFAFAFISIVLLSQSLIGTLSLAPSMKTNLYWLIAGPGLVLSLLSIIVAGVYTMLNRRALRYHYVRPHYSAEETTVSVCWTNTHDTDAQLRSVANKQTDHARAA